jgi:hypothetical protein
MVLDGAVGEKMNQIFLSDLQYAAEVTLGSFRRRSWLERIAERGASLITRLL